MSFEGKSVVITGGTTGLGLALIREVLKRGASNVAILDITDVDSAVAALSAEFADRSVIYIRTDVTSKDNVSASFEEAKSKFGYIDVVIGNAGIFNEKLPEMTILVNLLGTVHSTYTAIDVMSTKSGGRGGVVLNVASVLGLDSMYSAPAYVASKHGIVGLTRSFGDDVYFEMHGIRFITICPAQTKTPMLDCMANNLRGISAAELKTAFERHQTQTSEEFASATTDLLEKPKNGSIWVVESGKSTEITIPKYWRSF